MPLLVNISRPLLPYDHQQLRRHIPETNRLGALSIRWRKLGEAGITLVERGQYQRAVNKQAGKLAAIGAVELADDLNTALLPSMPGGNNRLTVPVINVDFFGEGPFRSIAYILESQDIQQQRSQLTAALDKRNGVNSDWEEFEPHVTLATVPAANMSDTILDAFWGFAPDQLTFQPAVAKAS